MKTWCVIGSSIRSKKMLSKMKPASTAPAERCRSCLYIQAKSVVMCLESGSNRRPLPLQGSALPTELSRQLILSYPKIYFISVLPLIQIENILQLTCRRQKVQIRLEEVERHEDNRRPKEKLSDEREPLVAPDCAEHPVIVFSKRSCLFKHSLKLRVHDS